MTNIRKSLSLVIAFCILTSIQLLYTDKAGAQQQTSISVSQSVIDIGGNQGDSLVSPLTITNNGDVYLPISIVIRPTQQNSGSILDPIYSAEAFTTINQSQFILSPGESKTVSVNVQIPGDIGPGGYYADIVTRALVLDDPNRITTTLPELATSLFVTVSGDIAESHTIQSLQGNTLFLHRGQQKTLQFLVVNTGNVHSLFSPQFVITDNQGVEEVSSGTPIILLPGEEAELEYTVSSEDLSVGIYNTELRYSFGAPLQEVARSSSRIVVTPFSFLLFALIICILGAYTLYRLRKRVLPALYVLIHGHARQ